MTDRLYDNYGKSPSLFVKRFIDFTETDGVLQYWINAWDSLAADRYLAIHSLNGMGLTSFMCITGLWFAITRDGVEDWKIAVTAPTLVSIKNYFIPELQNWFTRVRWDQLDRRPFDFGRQKTMLTGETGCMFNISSKNELQVEGMVGDNVLFLLDNAKRFKPDFTEAVEHEYYQSEKTLAVLGGTGSLDYGYEWTSKVWTAKKGIREGRLTPSAYQRMKEMGRA